MMSRAVTKPNPHAVTVERTLESTGSTVRLTIEPLPERHVLIVEYRRRRKPEGRFERQRSEEGKAVPFELLNLDEEFETLFPQGGLFDQQPAGGTRNGGSSTARGASGTASTRKVRRSRKG